MATAAMSVFVSDDGGEFVALRMSMAPVLTTTRPPSPGRKYAIG